ncbi:fatty acid desaturase [Reichenbachiella sp. 5M10]|uniref:fatty acid desaturase family protein n=1 Tax=Reichenbachiella sp. 5M10 TaxID=1889772 RepID=UPI000C156E86|nr:acyl-CoA desaturase [Reichenbachiella sp. 5M10]PIB34018.1 fatty acid desaturase [Reichenbachiella sp. 5M10]
MSQKYTFDSSSNSFFKTLRNKVDDYFANQNLHPSGAEPVYVKGLILVASAIGFYVTLVFFTPAIPISIVLCILLGINLGLIGFNVMHEGSHQCFSRHSWVNRISAYCLNILGGNAHYWSVKHNINHHTYTNIEGIDSDIDVKPFMRLHAGQPLRRYHRYQHIYWVILYGVSYLAWIFYEDFEKYFTQKITPISKKEALTPKEHFIFWFTKIAYMGVYMALPIYLVGWLPWLVGFLIITMTCGLIISIVFQLAHVVEDTAFHASDTKGGSPTEWAIHQVNSTANFATSSKILHWLLGGLNFQIEHHLFPRISHIHYPTISRLVKETCAEFNVTYNEYNTMMKAISSHLLHLRKLGKAAAV